MAIIWILFTSFVAAGVLWGLSAYLKNKALFISIRADAYDSLLNAFREDISQSSACCRSIVHLLGDGSRCECFRCRQERGEVVTEQSQMQAEAVQERAAKRFGAIVDGGQPCSFSKA